MFIILSMGHQTLTSELFIFFIFIIFCNKAEKWNRRNEIRCGFQAVWPDCEIFETAWLIFFLKFLDIFWSYFENGPCKEKNCYGYFLGNFGTKWATFCSNIWSHWLQVSIYVKCRRSNIFKFWSFKSMIIFISIKQSYNFTNK